jgi:hypothetical protein
MSGRPWLEALKVTIRERGTHTEKLSEKILEALPSERCERCESPTDVPPPLVDTQTAEKVRGSWGEEERRLIAAGWEPKERGGLVIWANPETGFYCSQEVALYRLEAREAANFRTFATQKARASWTLEEGRKRNEGESMSLWSFDSPTRLRHGLWGGVST